MPFFPTYHLLTGIADATPCFSVYLRLGLNENAGLKYCELSCDSIIFTWKSELSVWGYV